MSLLCSDLRAIVEPLTLNAVGSPEGLRLSDSTIDPSVNPRSRSRLRSMPCASRDTTIAARPGGRASSLQTAKSGTKNHHPEMCSGLTLLPTSRKFGGVHFLVPEYGVPVQLVMILAHSLAYESIRPRRLRSLYGTKPTGIRWSVRRRSLCRLSLSLRSGTS
jgi:hypothetical protein